MTKRQRIVSITIKAEYDYDETVAFGAIGAAEDTVRKFHKAVEDAASTNGVTVTAFEPKHARRKS